MTQKGLRWQERGAPAIHTLLLKVRVDPTPLDNWVIATPCSCWMEAYGVTQLLHSEQSRDILHGTRTPLAGLSVTAQIRELPTCLSIKMEKR